MQGSGIDFQRAVVRVMLPSHMKTFAYAQTLGSLTAERLAFLFNVMQGTAAQRQ